MQVISQSLPAMGQTDASASAPIFGAEAEKNTLNRLIDTHGEHAIVPGAPANAIFSQKPVMTTSVVKGGEDALIGKAFKSDSGDTVYLRSLQDAGQPTAIGNPDGASKSGAISFDDNVQSIVRPVPTSVEQEAEPVASTESTSTNPIEEALNFILALLASLLGNSSSNSSDTSDTANTQSESNSSNLS